MLFCDKVTDSIKALIEITKYRRQKQEQHNELHGISPRSVIRPVQQSLQQGYDPESGEEKATHINAQIVAEDASEYDVLQVISELESEMREAASKLEFERAAHIRDQINQLKSK